MRLSSAAAAALGRHGADIAVRQANSRRALARLGEVDRQRAASIKRAKRAQAVANASKQNWKLGAIYDLIFALELGRSEVLDTDFRDRRHRRVQAQALRFRFAIH